MGNILAVRGDEGRVLVSEMPRGADKHASIRGCPNGATPLLETAKTPD
jgi:hypothetical protein